jgi:hypothetical protein
MVLVKSCFFKKRGKKMKKIMLIIAVALGVLLVVGGLRYRMMGNKKAMSGSDLVIVNDTSDTISTEYMRNGKEMSEVVNSGDHATGGQGVMRIFVAKDEGSFELMYEYPRPAGSVATITVNQVMQSVKQEKFEGDLYIKKGMVGDVAVTYEEVRDLDATY